MSKRKSPESQFYKIELLRWNPKPAVVTHAFMVIDSTIIYDILDSVYTSLSDPKFDPYRDYIMVVYGLDGELWSAKSFSHTMLYESFCEEIYERAKQRIDVFTLDDYRMIFGRTVQEYPEREPLILPPFIPSTSDWSRIHDTKIKDHDITEYDKRSGSERYAYRLKKFENAGFFRSQLSASSQQGPDNESKYTYMG